MNRPEILNIENDEEEMFTQEEEKHIDHDEIQLDLPSDHSEEVFSKELYQSS
jgi:hypothetical protein